MKTRIANRVGRIISGSIHALIASLEGTAPEAIMEQAIREVDAVIDEVKQQLGTELASKHLATKRLLQKNAEHETLADQIHAALDAGRQDLGEAAVGRQLDIEAQIPVLEETIRNCCEQEKELENYILALQAKKREMHQELITFRESAKKTASPSSCGRPETQNDVTTDKRIEEATSAFDRMLAKGSEQLLDTTNTQQSVQLAELEVLSRKNRIKERLALLRSEGTQVATTLCDDAAASHV